MTEQVSQERDDFNFVYREFADLVGFDVSDHAPFVLPRLSNGHADENVITHPYREAWLESDFIEIQRIRSLGRFLIDDTRRRIEEAEGYEPPQSIGHVYFSFRAHEWYNNHPDVVYDDSKDGDPNSILPKNIAEFPHGEYVNCLGASIGMAALAESAGIRYLYANELRESDTEFRRNFYGLEKRIKRLHPNAFDLEGLAFTSVQVFDDTMREIDKQKKYHGIPAVSPPDLDGDDSEDDRKLRDYHHFLIMEYSDGDELAVVQVDPYSLVFTRTGVEHDDFEELQALHADETVIMYENLVESVYRKINSLLTDIEQISNGTPEERKSQLKDLVITTIKGLSLSNDEMAESIWNLFYGCIDNAYTIKMAKKMGMDKEASTIIDVIRDEARSVTERQEARKRVHDEIGARTKYDKDMQVLDIKLRGQIPAAMFMLVYRFALQETLAIRDSGSMNRAAEIGETDFNVGAMALNHYANSRKDGRINVAKYLARYSSSQLIWLAAACDGNSEEDPSMEALGEVVKSLKPAYMHPRVHLVVK